MSDTLGSLTERAYKPLPLDTFALDRAVLEVRYDAAYLFWDRSGQLWHEIAKTESKLRSLEAQPNRTSFAIEQSFQLSANLDSSRLIAHFPERNLKTFSAKCDHFFGIVIQTLEISQLSRVGFRLVYSREYPRIDDAAKALIDLNLMVLPNDRHFGVEASISRPEYTVRCEDTSLGFVIRIRTETQTTEIDLGFGIRDLKFERVARHRIVFDVDHYTTVPLRQGQFRPGEWIKDRLHATSRDSSAFLGD